MSRLGRIRRYARTPGDAFLLIGVLLYEGLLPILMRLPMPRVLEFTRWLNARLIRPRRREPLEVVNLVDAVGRLARWSFRANCVTRSLTLYAFLNRVDVPLQLCFGVRRIATEQGASPGRRHVWIVRDGEPLAESEPLAEYVTLYRFPDEIPKRIEPAVAPSTP